MVQVKTFYAFNDLRNFSYLIFDDQSGESWVIDPYEADPIIDYIKKNALNLLGILNTHQHHDHIRGNAPLIKAFNAQAHKLHGKEVINLNETTQIDPLDTPGHTTDHKAFLLKTGTGPWSLFSGDTLFNSGVGNCKNGGDLGMLYKTTLNLSKLPRDTTLYPGHDYLKRNLEFALSVEPDNKSVREALKLIPEVSPELRVALTLGHEQEVNPFFRLFSEQLRKQLSFSEKSLDDEAIFFKLRTLRDHW